MTVNQEPMWMVIERDHEILQQIKCILKEHQPLVGDRLLDAIYTIFYYYPHGFIAVYKPSGRLNLFIHSIITNKYYRIDLETLYLHEISEEEYKQYYENREENPDKR